VGRSVQHFTATGWGTTEWNEPSTILQTVTLSKINRKYCKGRLRQNIDASQLCVGGPRKDTCSGDAGGPLSLTLKIDGDGKWNNKSRAFLIGIVSYGSSSCSGIGVYTNVEHYMDWIVRTINKSNTEKIANVHRS